jgi:hypothetical protein
VTTSADGKAFDVRVGQVLALERLEGVRVLGGRSGRDLVVSQVRLAPEGRLLHGDYTAAVILVDGSLLSVDTYVVDFTLRWMHESGAALLLLVTPAHEVGVASIRLADKYGIVLAQIDGAVLELADDLREVIGAPQRTITRLALEAVERLGRVSAQQGVQGSLAVLDATLNSSSSLVGLEGEVVQGAVLDPHLDPKDRVTVQVIRREGDLTRLVQPVSLASGEPPSFWLVVEALSPTPMWEQAATTVVKLASSYVATRLMSDRLEQERDARVRLGVLNAIIALADRPSASLVQQVSTLGWKTDGWCAAVHIRIGGGADPLRVLSLTDELRGVLVSAGFDGPIVERPDGWTTWSFTPTEPPPTSFRESVVAVRRSLQRFVAERDGLRVYAGVGRPYTGIAGLRKSLAEAQEAATIAQAGGTRTGVQHIDELGVQRILVGWYTSEEFGDFARTLLRPVAEIDRDEDLMRTLEVYLDNESSPTVTANVLGLHRNTVINRVSRIRSVLPVDLDDPDQRLAVQLACRVINLRA